MVSSFSDAVYLIYRPRHRRARFFEQPVLQHHLGEQLFELYRPDAQRLDFIRGGLALRITGQSLLAGLQKLLRPTIVQVLVDLLPAAQLRDAFFAAKPLQHDPDIFLRGIASPCRPRIALTLFSALPLEWFFFVLIASSFQMTMSSITLPFDHPYLSN